MPDILDHKGDVISEWHRDPMTGEVTIGTRQKVDRILTRNARLRTADRRDVAGLRHVASIPVAEYYRWLEAKGITPRQYSKMPAEERWALMRERLNDGDYKKLRIEEGAL